jgi:hypothetical protein
VNLYEDEQQLHKKTATQERTIYIYIYVYITQADEKNKQQHQRNKKNYKGI